jgi:hypothetical protein
MKRLRIIIILLAVLLTGVFVIYLVQPSEPSYQGRKLSAWLKGYYSYSLGWFGQHDKEDEALRQMGTNAIPFLMKMSKTEDSKFKQKFTSLVRKQSLIRFQFTTAVDIRARAYCGFRALGKAVKPMVPTLTGGLGDSELLIRSLAAEALVNTGLGGIQPLTNALSSTNWMTRLVVVEALGMYGDGFEGQWHPALTKEELAEAKKQAIPILLGLLNDTNARLRSSAVYALGSIHQQPDIVVPALSAFATNPAEINHSGALWALGKFGLQAKSVVPQIIRAFDDPQLFTRVEATNALKKIDPEAAQKAGIR